MTRLHSNPHAAQVSEGERRPSPATVDDPGAGVHRGRRASLPSPARRRSTVTAAVLSFIWPGSGHAYLHRRRRAVALALPPLLLTAVAFVLIASDPTGFAVAMLAPEVAIVILALLGLHGLWRAGAIIDSWRAARAARAARRCGPECDQRAGG